MQKLYFIKWKLICILNTSLHDQRFSVLVNMFVSKFKETFQRAEYGQIPSIQGYCLKQHHSQHKCSDSSPIWGLCFNWSQRKCHKTICGSVWFYKTCVFSLWTLWLSGIGKLHLTQMTKGKHASVSHTFFPFPSVSTSLLVPKLPCLPQTQTRGTVY